MLSRPVIVLLAALCVARAQEAPKPAPAPAEDAVPRPAANKDPYEGLRKQAVESHEKMQSLKDKLDADWKKLRPCHPSIRVEIRDVHLAAREFVENWAKWVRRWHADIKERLEATQELETADEGGETASLKKNIEDNRKQLEIYKQKRAALPQSPGTPEEQESVKAVEAVIRQVEQTIENWDKAVQEAGNADKYNRASREILSTREVELSKAEENTQALLKYFQEYYRAKAAEWNQICINSGKIDVPSMDVPGAPKGN